MNKALLDTDTLSEISKGRDVKVASRAAADYAVFGRFTLTVFSVLEVVKGYHRLRRPDRITRFLAGIAGEEVISLDVRSSEIAGRIFADLELAGRPIDRIDPMIAALAIERGLTLVTGNTTHYQYIQQLGYPLSLDNWRA